MWFGLGCFVLATDHAVGANALIPFTGCAVVTIECNVCVCMNVCLYVADWALCVCVYHCTVELCEGGGSNSVLLLVRLLLENDQSCVHSACKREREREHVCVPMRDINYATKEFFARLLSS